jgi:pimeloyl-ACP methyl ester carboxylesterase
MNDSLNCLIGPGQPKLSESSGLHRWAKDGRRLVPAGERKFLFSLVTLLSFSLILLSGCAAPREIHNLRDVPVPITPPLPVEKVVFAADGAGDFRISSSQLRKVVCEDCVPIHVIPFVWSHGYAKIVKDQMDQAHALCQGQRLAQTVLAYRQEHPNLPIVLYGHSAGCGVVLSAMEQLPPGIVERCFLLSASVTTCHDLRPALRAVDKGIFVYYSKRECLFLSVALRLQGIFDRECAVAGGRVGFRVCVECPEDLALYAKLYQRPWTPCDRMYGNTGNHYGNYQPDFIRTQILPVLLGGEPGFPPAVCAEKDP